MSSKSRNGIKITGLLGSIAAIITIIIYLTGSNNLSDLLGKLKNENTNVENNITIPSYNGYPQIPDFGEMFDYEPFFEQRNLNIDNIPTLYTYFVDIERIRDEINRYEDKLGEQGFLIITKNVLKNDNDNSIVSMVATYENITVSIRVIEKDPDDFIPETYYFVILDISEQLDY